MPYCILYRLGEACNHIAALLFFIENHVNDEELPLELSKTSKLMARHQPPKKKSLQNTKLNMNMKFVKPSNGDNPGLQEVSEIKSSSFDPCLPEHRVEINPDHLHALLTDV